MVTDQGKKFGNFEMREFIQFCWRWNNQYPTRPLFDGRVPLASATPAIHVEGISRVSILIAARPVFFLTSSNFWCSNKKTFSSEEFSQRHYRNRIRFESFASSVNSAVLISEKLEFIRTTLISSNFCLIFYF